MAAMKIIIDLDHTITAPSAGDTYDDVCPNSAVVARLRDYRAQGFEIVIYSSRNMRTYAGNLGKINIDTLPRILAWLGRHDIPFDEVIVGKPWCGHGGFYVDDKAIRPDEFATLSLTEIYALVGEEAPQ